MNRKFMNFTSVSLALLMSVSCFAPYVPTSVYASESESVQVSTETGDTSSETIQIDTAEKSVASSVSVGEAADSNIVVDNTDGYSVGDAIPVHVKASNTGKEDVKFRVYFWDYDKELPKDKTTWAEKLKTVCSDVQISEFKDKNPISVKLTKDKDSQKADVTFAQETDEKTKDVTARYLSLTLPAGTTLDTVFHVTSDSAETVTVVPVSDSEFGDATQITWNKKDVVVESDEKKENGSEDIKIGTSDINFEPVPDENKEDSDTGIVDISSDIEKVDEASKEDSDVNVSESEEDTKTSTEVSTETETTTDSEVESETETDTKTEADTEVSTDSKSDVVLDTETDSETETSSTEEEHFLDAVAGVEELNASDFSSARLVVLTSDENVIVDKEHLIGSYDNLYLLQYKSSEQAMNAYVYYQTHAVAVEPDMTLDAADNEDVTGTGEAELSVTEDVNPINSLENEDDSEVAQKADKVIALIDTGASESSNVIDRVSLIDDVMAGNGHGDKMVEAIASQDADAKILSIRTMGNDGRGTVSSIVAGMEYAINQKVSIINLSMYAKSNLSNSVIASEIQKAVDAGIEVVGAAGNDGADVKDYMPGSVDAAWIIGAADETGMRLSASNYGDTVDYNVVASSTSEAAAKFSGYVSKNGTNTIVVNEDTIYTTDYEAENVVTPDGNKYNVNVVDGSEYTVHLNHEDGIYESGEKVVYTVDAPEGVYVGSTAVHPESNKKDYGELIYSEIQAEETEHTYSFVMPTEDVDLKVFQLFMLDADDNVVSPSDDVEESNTENSESSENVSTDNSENTSEEDELEVADSYGGDTGVDSTRWYYRSDGTTHPFDNAMGSGGQDSYKWVKYKDEDGNWVEVQAFCMQHSKHSPTSGTDYPFKNAVQLTSKGGDDVYLRKAIFYGEGGPAWKKTVNKHNIYNIMKKYGCPDDTMRAMQHYIVDYLYDGESGFGGALSTAAKNMIKEIKTALADMPDPVRDRKLLPGLSSTATSSVSETFTWKADDEFTLTFKVPSGVKCVNETTKVTSNAGASVTIRGGQKFHLESVGATGTTKIRVKSNFPLDYHAMLLKFSGDIQDIGFGYRTNGKYYLEVKWPEVAHIQIKKTDKDGKWNNTLKGAEFSLYEGSSKKETITINNGEYHKFAYDCRMGHIYTVKETKTPSGYTTASDITCSITSSNYKTTYSYDVKNYEAPKVQITKTSSAPASILGLSGYNIKDAEFGIYTDANCTNKLTTLKTGDDGKTGVYTLPCKTAGTYNYWVREDKAPAGHKRNTTPEKVTVKLPDDNGKTKSVIMSNEPEFTTLDAVVEKLSVKGWAVPGVVFKAQLYDGDKADSSKLKKTWYLKSDSDGKVYFDARHRLATWTDPSTKKSYTSDSFYTYDNEIKIPLGCFVTIQEIDAPATYTMDTKVYSWNTKGKEMKVQRIYNKLTPSTIHIKKYNAAGKKVLANIPFKLTFVKQSETYTDNALKTYVPLLKEGESTTVKTDSNGEITWDNLDQGEYQITEVQTVNGDTLLKDPINVTLPITMTDAEVKTYKADTSKGTFDTDYSKKWFFYDATYEVTNDYTFKLPQTGGMGTWKYGFIGVGIAVVLAGGLFVHDSLNKKRKRKRA